MAAKFNLDRKPVPDEEINSHKDFGELVNKFKKQSIEKARSDVNFLKNKKVTYSAVIAGVAVICTVTYFSVFKKQPPKETTNDKIVTSQTQQSTSSQPKQNKAFIAPPIAKLNIPYTAYKVKSEQGATIKHSSGSKIVIPKKTFVNKQGQDIVGDVEIKYREFHNQADIIASGIPMTYDSAGVQSHFESAGMIDIKGYQNGEPIFIKPDKKITVEFQSEHTADRYNMYVLDTIAKNWTYLNRDNSLVNSKVKSQKLKANDNRQSAITNDSPKITELQKQLDAIPPKIEAEKAVYTKKLSQLPKKSAEPSKPAKAVAGRPQFELDVNYKEFPELAAFKNAIFEVGPENKNFNPKLADITWNSAEISEGTDKGKNYTLTLKLKERVEKLIVYPALTGTDYDNALKSYESKFADYQKAVVKREADEKKLKEEFEARQAAYIQEQKNLSDEILRERIKQRKEWEQKMEQEMAEARAGEKVTRIFQVNSFNIFNSDCPKSLPSGANMRPVFVVNDKNIRPESVYLICLSKNLVYNLPYGNLPYNPAEKYSICIVSRDKIFVCSKEQFSNAVAANQTKIPMTEITDNTNNIFDFKKAIGI